MKNLLAILFLAVPCMASGPKYIGSKADPATYQEFQNVYQDIKSPVISIGSASTMTITYLNVSTITLNGMTLRKARTRQILTSGSGTYTTPAGVLYLQVRMVGGGGGGVGSGTGAGTASGNGGDTTFGSSLLTAGGGLGGSWASGPNAGGSATIAAGPTGIALAGSYGDPLNDGQGTSQRPAGGSGGTSPFGGAGAGGQVTQAGFAGITNTGSGGGGGGGISSASEVVTGQGGGAGGYIDALISTPSATYAYAIGVAGSAGGAGTGGRAGAAGGSGIIIVDEFYF